MSVGIQLALMKKSSANEILKLKIVVMNHNKKIIKAQQNISLKKLKNSNLDFLQSFIKEDNLSEVLKNRNRIYSPQKTLSMFISQSLNQDGSCQNRVNKLALSQDKKISINTSGYCKARARLSTSAISTLTKTIAIDNENKIPNNLKFREIRGQVMNIYFSRSTFPKVECIQ